MEGWNIPSTYLAKREYHQRQQYTQNSGFIITFQITYSNTQRSNRYRIMPAHGHVDLYPGVPKTQMGSTKCKQRVQEQVVIAADGHYERQKRIIAVWWQGGEKTPVSSR